MEVFTARCHCGDLQIACEGRPRKVSMCHCPDCQRRSGSVFSIAAFYEHERVSVLGPEASRFERPSAIRHPVTFRFCARCGSNLYWEPARMPGLIGVAVGAFADLAFPAPEQSVWTKDKHAWVTLPADMPQFDEAPPPRAWTHKS